MGQGHSQQQQQRLASRLARHHDSLWKVAELQRYLQQQQQELKAELSSSRDCYRYIRKMCGQLLALISYSKEIRCYHIVISGSNLSEETVKKLQLWNEQLKTMQELNQIN